ncbi:hypothetical protein QQ045_030422 [Rhodiola kirilowii]
MERNIKGRKDNCSSSNGSRQNNNSRENGTEGNLTLEELLAAWYLILLAANLVTNNFTQRSLMAAADVKASNNVWYPQHDAYYCWLCGTHLAEFQGLGDPFACQNYRQAQTEESSSSRPPTKRQRVAKPHECTICGRVFATGQAMGGHMIRAHYRDDLTRARPAMASSSSSVAADGHIGEVSLENNVGSSVADYDDGVYEVVDSKSNIMNQIGNNSSRGSTSHRPVDLDLNVKLEDESEVKEDHEEDPEEEIDRVDGA